MVATETQEDEPVSYRSMAPLSQLMPARVQYIRVEPRSCSSLPRVVASGLATKAIRCCATLPEVTEVERQVVRGDGDSR